MEKRFFQKLLFSNSQPESWPKDLIPLKWSFKKEIFPGTSMEPDTIISIRF